MDNLFNAAWEYIEDRIAIIEENRFNDYTPEDLESAKREQALIEQEIAHIARMTEALRHAKFSLSRHPLTSQDVGDVLRAINKALNPKND